MKIEGLAASKSLVASIAISVANFFLLYWLNIILANQLDPAEYGDFSVAITTVNFLAQISILGLDKLATRFLPTFLHHKEYDKSHGLIRYSFIVAIIASSGIAIAGVFVMGFFVQQGANHPLFLALWFIPLVTFIRIFAYWIYSSGYFYTSQWPRFLLDPPISLGLIYLVFLLDKKITSFIAVSIFGIAWGTVVVLQLIFLKLLLPKKIFEHKPKYERKKWLNISIPMILANSIVFLSLSQINIWLLELIGKNESVVGIYSALVQTVLFCMLVLVSIITFMDPLLSKSYATNHMKEFLKLIIIGQRTLLSAALLLCTCLIIFGKQILGFFGPEYVSAYPALLVTLIGMFFQLSCGIALNILQNVGHERSLLLLTIAAIGLHLILVFLIIPWFGLNGVVVVTSFTMALIYLGYSFLVWYYLKINIFKVILHRLTA